MTQYQMTEDEQKIYGMFHGRCVRCNSKAVTIHEIIPRSHGNGTMDIENRVPVCADCHSWAHDVGTKNSIPILQQYRKDILASYDK